MPDDITALLADASDGENQPQNENGYRDGF